MRKIQNNKTNKMKNIGFKFASVYSGGGLGSFGAHKAGGQEVFAVDYNKIAEKVFRNNFPDVPFHNMDALNVTKDKMIELGHNKNELENLDLLLLSPPCTGISRVNINRHPFMPVNSLLLDSPRLVREFTPKVAIIENVEGILDDVMKPLLSLFISKCKALTDYNFEYRILNANEFGVPQRRKRFIAMLVRKDVGMPIFPEPTTKDYEALYINRLFPNLIGIDAGGTRKKILSDSGDQIGKRNKWTHTNQPCPTLTATGGELILDILDGVREMNRHERIAFCGTQGMNFEGITDKALRFVSGNGIMPPLMEAICNTLTKAYFNNRNI
jgi:site-specific DNA-cytosine methylase